MPKSQPTLGQRHLQFWAAELKPGTRYVYVIRGGKGTPVKIGSALKPYTRLKQLQTGNPQSLRVLLVTPGDKRFEKFLHGKFSEHRMGTSEWFHAPAAPEIINFMREYCVWRVQNHTHGREEPPEHHLYPGWTEDELKRLPRKEPLFTIPLTDPSPDRDPHPLEVVYNFVPTLKTRVCRTRLAPDQTGGSFTQ